MEFVFIFSAVGFLIMAFGLINIIVDIETFSHKIIAIVGALIFVSSIGLILYKDEQGTELLLQDIAEHLNAEAADIIVEDISEDKLFAPSKNTNLRKVYYQDETYLFEVEDFKVNKMSKLSSDL